MRSIVWKGSGLFGLPALPTHSWWSCGRRRMHVRSFVHVKGAAGWAWVELDMRLGSIGRSNNAKLLVHAGPELLAHVLGILQPSMPAHRCTCSSGITGRQLGTDGHHQTDGSRVLHPLAWLLSQASPPAAWPCCRDRRWGCRRLNRIHVEVGGMLGAGLGAVLWLPAPDQRPTRCPSRSAHLHTPPP